MEPLVGRSRSGGAEVDELSLLEALAVPPDEGFNRMSWLMPPIAIAMGLMGIAWWIKRSRRPVLLTELPDGSADRIRAELDKEMAKFE